MASDVYNRCEGQIQHPETQSSILCWGALLAYIDCIRLHNGLELLNAPNGFFEGGSNAHRNEVSQTPALYKLLHSKNAVPDHGIAFYVLTKYFDDFVVSGVGEESTLNNLYSEVSHSQTRYRMYYCTQYPVFIYSMADFVQLFNFLCTSEELGDPQQFVTRVTEKADELRETKVNI